MLQQGESHYRTDFNSVRDDGLLSALYGLGGSSDVPGEGDVVRLFDGDGNACRAVVVRADADLVYAWPDWSTWRAVVHFEVDLADALKAQLRSFLDDSTTGRARDPLEVFELDPA